MTTIQDFANRITEEMKAYYIERYGSLAPHGDNYVARVKPGKKYTKVDVGSSGKYMVDEQGNIFGIKGYGVIHRGHQYGTLDTIDEWHWGNYHAMKRCLAAKKGGQTS